LRRSARDAEDGSQGRPAKQDLRGLRTAVRLAQEMGAGLGRGEVLFGAVPGGEGEGGLGFAFSGAGAGEAGRVIGDPGLGDERRWPLRVREWLHRWEGTRRREGDRWEAPLRDARIGDMARRAIGFVGHGERVGGGVGCRTVFFWGCVPKVVRRGDLPVRTCAGCGLSFAWRKNWARDWDAVKFCSERCRGEKGKGLFRPRDSFGKEGSQGHAACPTKSECSEDLNQRP
jgi:hypothetical protein